MPQDKIRIEVEPIGKRIYLKKPANGLEACKEGGIDIKSVCGGKGTCGKCRIVLLGGNAPPLSGQEKKALSSGEIKKGVRLACQQTFAKDQSIYIPASSLTEEQKLQVTGTEKEIEADPVCKKYYLKMDPATIKDTEPDFERIRSGLKKTCEVRDIDFSLLKKLPCIVRENDWKVTVTVREDEAINIEGKDKTGENYGIALDLGTTKIAVLLVDLNTGKTMGSRGVMNPQISYGEDVMSRLHFALSGSRKLKELQKMVIGAVNEAISHVCVDNGIKKEQISEITVVANTAMHHLFLGLPVKQLSLSPFVSLVGNALSIKARELGIDICSGGYVYLLPPIAGFVGSDHLAMILSADIEKQKGNVIGIDIGTNTEIALKAGKTITSVSTASGPAFEGAHIRYGMKAAPGAIERVVIDDSCKPVLQTIGDKKASGICGSGILDSIAELRRTEIIDNRGKFNKQSKCIGKGQDGNYRYILAKKDGPHNQGDGEDISISQEDIVQIQLAKGAMRAGIEILLEDAGIDFTKIDKIIIAGAFGSYIDPRNIVNIGMFPNVPVEKIIQVGNAAGMGSKMVLISSSQRKKAEKLAKKVKYLELTTYPGFQDHYVNSLKFPQPEEII